MNLLVEGDIDEAVAQRLVTRHAAGVATTYGKQGFGYIQTKLPAFAQASAGMPLLALVDLMDTRQACAPHVLLEWLPYCPPTALFRVAVREIESWVLADRAGISDYLRVPIRRVPSATDDLTDPKRELIAIARHSRSRLIREAIVPSGEGAVTGILYNSSLVQFVRELWDPEAATAVSPSLQRADAALRSFIDSHCGHQDEG